MLRRLMLATALVEVALGCCPKSAESIICGGKGDCHTADCVCKCRKGFIGGDCSQRSCPLGYAWTDHAVAVDNAHHLTECANMGVCDRTTGMCTCNMGFEGLSCSRKSCPAGCSGHGNCQSMQYAATQKDPGEGAISVYDANWDAHMMYGCVCDRGYAGPDCMLRDCPTGDDPLTGTVDDPNGVQFDEKQTVTCKATNGKFTLSFRREPTSYISYDESLSSFYTKFHSLSTIREATITYSGITSTACTSMGNIITIIFTQEFGDLPLIVADITLLIHSSAVQDPSIIVKEEQKGNKEDNYCSDRGNCDTLTGTCACQLNYDTSNGLGATGTQSHNRGDCGFATAGITACPGEVACSGHGVCRQSPTYRCLCSAGWQGADCSERTCKYERAWFDEPTADNTAHKRAECSNIGTCDRTKGECVCTVGFTGGACERMTCPGTPECSGHGQCLYMAQLAQKATSNGDSTATTYGSTPNKKETWDFDKLQGCMCDEGYEGYDCSLRSCPVGDDMRTPNDVHAKQYHEVQALTCTATSGFFTLKFRQQETVAIPYDANEEVVAKALLDLKTIGLQTKESYGKWLAGPQGGVGGGHVDKNVEWKFDGKMSPSQLRPASGALSARTGGQSENWWSRNTGRINVAFTKVASLTNGKSEQQLEQLVTNIGDVNKACTETGDNTVLVTFLTELGDLPALTTTDSCTIPSCATTFKIETDGAGLSVKGTRERTTCSGRGTCDHFTGLCTCFEGFGSSDGAGGPGIRRDCGYVHPEPMTFIAE
jgi:hypothetical protein